jgi:hypothetical protein
MSDKKRPVYVYAEYCPGDFFWGWWLYLCPIEGDAVERKRYEWLHRTAWKIDDLNMAVGLPVLYDYRGKNHTACTEAFLEKYPNGIVLWEVGGRDFEMPAEGDVLPPAWKCLKAVREGQLLDWKNSDESYLGKREQEMSTPAPTSQEQQP